MSPQEREAVCRDAESRLVELRRVAARLWSDRDDSHVLSELHTVLGQMRKAEAAIRDHGTRSQTPTGIHTR